MSQTQIQAIFIKKAVMKISIERLSGDFMLEARNEDGRTVIMDAAESIGGTNKGVRPMQLILIALGGCSAFDVISILKKQRLELKDIKVEVDGEREDVKDGAATFSDISAVYKLEGDIEKEKAIRAVQLSMEKYCSVTKILKPTASIKVSILLNGIKIYEQLV